VAVCTIEKANVAINRLVQQGRLQELCCVIVDVSLVSLTPGLPYNIRSENAEMRSETSC